MRLALFPLKVCKKDIAERNSRRLMICKIHSLTVVKQEKPQGHYPAVPPSPRGVKDIMVTQDTSSSLCSERRDKYDWPSKNRRSGASDHQKNGK